MVTKPRPPRYCHTCGHTNDRHKVRVFGKTGTSCEAPLGHGTTCPCKQWSPPLPPKPVTCTFCGKPLGVGGVEGRCADCVAKIQKETAVEAA